MGRQSHATGCVFIIADGGLFLNFCIWQEGFMDTDLGKKKEPEPADPDTVDVLRG